MVAKLCLNVRTGILDDYKLVKMLKIVLRYLASGLGGIWGSEVVVVEGAGTRAEPSPEITGVNST